MSESTDVCCPEFNPEPWDEKTIEWDGKRFVKDRIRSFFHIPLNFGGVMKRCMARIMAAEAAYDNMIVLCDENSLWGADAYIDVTKDVPGARMATISGTFKSKVFEGPYKNVPKWVKEMTEYVKSSGDQMKKIYVYYTTCPKCAKKYGKNYVVMLAQV